MSSGIILNSIISFISAQFTQIQGVLIATRKPGKQRQELVGENGNIPFWYECKTTFKLLANSRCARFQTYLQAGKRSYWNAEMRASLVSYSQVEGIFKLLPRIGLFELLIFNQTKDWGNIEIQAAYHSNHMSTGSRQRLLTVILTVNFLGVYCLGVFLFFSFSFFSFSFTFVERTFLWSKSIFKIANTFLWSFVVGSLIKR